MHSKIEGFETKVRNLAVTHREGLTEKIKLAILVGMLPEELQREAFRGVDEMEMSYAKTRDDIIAMVDRKLGAEKPVPMEIGNVGAGKGKKEFVEDLESPPGLEVDAIGEVSKCLRCGGIGHFARECGTLKGKGLDAKGFGKGDFGKGGFGKNSFGGGFGKGDFGKGFGKGKGDFGKGFGKGKGDFGKGFGKGKSSGIECYNCGKFGHKADTCWSPKKHVREVGFGESVEGDVEGEEGVKEFGCVESWGSVGSVWDFCSVESSGFGGFGFGGEEKFGRSRERSRPCRWSGHSRGGDEDDEDLEELQAVDDEEEEERRCRR